MKYSSNKGVNKMISGMVTDGWGLLLAENITVWCLPLTAKPCSFPGRPVIIV